MTKLFKPMLASPADLDAVRFPIYASPKLDGIRASVVQGKLLSRTLKEIPSRYIFKLLSLAAHEGLDGELIVGDPTSSTCYRDTVSGVMADNKTPAFQYHVFDLWDRPHLPMKTRLAKLQELTHTLNFGFIKRVEHVVLNNREELDAYEGSRVAVGYEGIMLADPDALYKFGRATTKGGELLKVKRFTDSEAVVIGMEEEMFNGNEAEMNELGRTKRSTAKDGLIGKGTMGALVVRDVKTGVEFNIGTGFTAADRTALWATPPVGQTVKYKSFEIGVKSKPRHPVFLGFRPAGA